MSSLSGAREIPMAHTQTFKVFERDGYKIVDLSAPLVSWGGDAKGPDQRARIVMVPRDREPPELVGDLTDAVVVQTPVQRVAVNYGFLEAVLTTLGVEDRLVAVGGVKSYNDGIRTRAVRGEIEQVGYGWHAPPNIDPLIAAQPDVFLMVLGDLGHAEHYERIKDLGIPVIPIFFEAEPNYMGPVDYIRLVGMMVGREAEAEAFVETVDGNIARLKQRVAGLPRKKVLSAWHAGGGRWMTTVRNAENALLVDAGGFNPLAQPDDIRQDDFIRLSSETLLDQARDVDCWIIRDSHSQSPQDVSFLSNFKSWREGCVYAWDGSRKPEYDAYDIYETGPLRPDWILGDMIRMLHPNTVDREAVYLVPDTEVPSP